MSTPVAATAWHRRGSWRRGLVAQPEARPASPSAPRGTHKSGWLLLDNDGSYNGARTDLMDGVWPGHIRGLCSHPSACAARAAPGVDRATRRARRLVRRRAAPPARRAMVADRGGRATMLRRRARRAQAAALAPRPRGNPRALLRRLVARRRRGYVGRPSPRSVRVGVGSVADARRLHRLVVELPHPPRGPRRRRPPPLRARADTSRAALVHCARHSGRRARRGSAARGGPAGFRGDVCVERRPLPVHSTGALLGPKEATRLRKVELRLRARPGGRHAPEQ